MSIFTRRPLLRWIVPAGVTLAVLGGGAATRLVTASADPTLPARDAASLLVDLHAARLDGLSGTVVERADLGLPSIPGLSGGGSTELTSLLSGSHTLRVWISGPGRARVALLGTLGETDVIVNQRDLWIWDSKMGTATHRVFPDERSDKAGSSPMQSLVPTNPKDLAEQALKLMDPTTVVSTAGTARVAGRSAYELVLAPRDTASLISQVRIAIDADRHLPLRVQVYANHSDTPGFECAFTQVNFSRPDDEQFRFNPPEGTKVVESSPSHQASPAPSGNPAPGAGTGNGVKAAKEPTILGTGWTSVLVMRAPASIDLTAGGKTTTKDPDVPQAQLDQLNSVLSGLPKVTGPWGSGWLLSGKLFSALVTSDGRILVGAVTPDRLTTLAADPASALKETP